MLAHRDDQKNTSVSVGAVFKRRIDTKRLETCNSAFRSLCCVEGNLK